MFFFFFFGLSGEENKYKLIWVHLRGCKRKIFKFENCHFLEKLSNFSKPSFLLSECHENLMKYRALWKSMSWSKSHQKILSDIMLRRMSDGYVPRPQRTALDKDQAVGQCKCKACINSQIASSAHPPDSALGYFYYWLGGNWRINCLLKTTKSGGFFFFYDESNYTL